MMIQKTEKNSVVSLLLIGSLVVLTGCFGEKEKVTQPAGQEQESQASSADKGDVLLSIDGKAVLYADDFEDQKKMAQQLNQQLNMILQMMPDAEYSMLFKSIEAGHLMKAWVVRSGIDQKPELVKQRRQYHDAIELQLYMKYYEDAHPIEVTEQQAKAFYLAKRDQIPGLIITPASVEILYVNCSTKSQAENLLGKIKDGSEKHFKPAAKEANLKVETMKISLDTQINDALKNSVLAATKFPSKEVVKMDDNAYWVVSMIKKQDAEYRPFDMPEIKKGITDMCRNEKREQELTKQVAQLSKEYNVVENVAYFENKKQDQAEALNKVQQESADEDSLDDEIMLEDKI